MALVRRLRRTRVQLTRHASFEEAVVEVIRAIPRGSVLSYGEVAREAGFEGAARAVGNLLRVSGGKGLPWWRVIRADGRLPKGHQASAAELLRGEGVEVTDWRVRRMRARRPPQPAPRP